jgi:hypothetical protein
MKLLAPFLFSCFILILAFAILGIRGKLTPRRAWAMTAMAAIFWLSMEIEWRIPNYFADGIDSYFVAMVKVSSLFAIFRIFQEYVAKDKPASSDKVEQKEENDGIFS